jgi:hypothetical protein
MGFPHEEMGGRLAEPVWLGRDSRQRLALPLPHRMAKPLENEFGLIPLPLQLDSGNIEPRKDIRGVETQTPSRAV